MQRNSISAPSPARVTLPNDLSGSLKYLDDAQLNRLLEAVTVVWANRALLDEGPMVRIRLSPAESHANSRSQGGSIFKRTIKALGPEMRPSQGIDQLLSDPHSTAGSANRAFEQLAHTQLEPDLL